jgi:hypothetical protein
LMSGRASSVNFMTGTIAAVRDLVIVISDFFVPVSATAPSHYDERALTGLSTITRFGTSSAISHGWRPWLARWFGREDLANVAPASVAAVDRPSAPMSWLAQPVYLTAGMRSVHMDFAGLLRLDADTQARFVEWFEADFAHTQYRLSALPTGSFLLRGPAAAPLLDRDPARFLGATIETAMPSGADAAILQRLTGEMEMWLHANPIGVRRPVTNLWFWGGGAALDLRRTQDPVAVYGEDAYAGGLAQLLGSTAQPLPSALPSAHFAERTAIIVEAFRLPEGSPISTPLQALEAIDRQWIAPAFDALSRGQVERLTIVANDRCLSVRSRDRLKLWRRRRGALAGWQ